MVDSAIVDTIKRYLAALPDMGIHPACAVLFGSFARGDAHEWSDIDLVVIAPEFDHEYGRALLENLWLATAAADNRIAPIPCGEREWDTNGGRPVLTIARREGILIKP